MSASAGALLVVWVSTFNLTLILLCLGNKQGEEINGSTTHLVNHLQPTPRGCAVTAACSWDTKIRNGLHVFTGAATVFLFPVAEQTCCTTVYVKVLCETRCPQIWTALFSQTLMPWYRRLRTRGLPLYGSSIKTFCYSLAKFCTLWKKPSLSASW